MSNFKYPLQVKLKSTAPWPAVDLPGLGIVTQNTYTIIKDNNHFKFVKPVRRHILVENSDIVAVEEPVSDATLTPEEIEDISGIDEKIKGKNKNKNKHVIIGLSGKEKKADLIELIIDLDPSYADQNLTILKKDELISLYNELTGAINE